MVVVVEMVVGNNGEGGSSVVAGSNGSMSGSCTGVITLTKGFCGWRLLLREIPYLFLHTTDNRLDKDCLVYDESQIVNDRSLEQ